MKTQSFNINRIGALLRYDWMLNKRTIGLTAAVIVSIYAFLVFCYFIIKRELDFNGSEALPATIGVFIHSFFSYANLAMMLVITTILTKKFCEPRTSTSYLTLPGTSIEKFTVMLIDYLAGFLGVYALYFVVFYITMGICALVNPNLDWALNAFTFINPLYSTSTMQSFMGSPSFEEAADSLEQVSTGFGDTFLGFLHQILFLAPFTSLMAFAYYLVLNMLFRTNCQIKSIACYYLTSFVFVIILVICIIAYSITVFNVNDINDAYVADKMSMVFTIVLYALYAAPFIAAGLFYVFYRQICRKQAK